MRIKPQCVPCIYGVRAREIVESRLGDEEKIAALAELTRWYGGQVEPGSSTIVLATLAFRRVKELIRDPDPYRDYKERSYELGRRLAEETARRAGELTGFERFKFLLKASIAANLLDPGAPLGVEPERLLEEAEGLVLARDETEEFYLHLLQSDRVSYLLDNAGETMLDRLVIGEMARMGLRVRVFAKGAPYQNDTTYEEALRIGLGDGAELVSTETDAAGPVRSLIPGHVWEKIVDADIIVAKGMANFEAFLDNPPATPLFAMLVAKCGPVAEAARVRPGEAAAFYAALRPGMMRIR